MLNNNTWNHLNVCEQMMNIKQLSVLDSNTWNH